MEGSPDSQIRALERELVRLRERVERLEGARPAEPPPPAQPALERELVRLRERVERLEGARPAEPPPPAQPAAPARDPLSFEDLLGGRVLAWAGGVAVVVGVAFFLVMAANRGWIDETTRVLLAFAGSTALLGAGLYLHERKGRTQAALAGVATAIAALYLTITAATQLYDLVDPVLGLVFAGLVGATATAIAVRWSEPAVAGIGLVGALLSPVLVDSGANSAALAFMAVALVATVAVLLRQRWSWLAVVAFAVGAPQLLGWLYDQHEERLGLSVGVLAAFWLVYVVAAVGYELRVPTAALRLTSAGLVLANAALLAGAGWAMLQGTGHEGIATAWVIAAAAVHIGGGIPAYGGRMSKEIAALIVAVGTALAALGLALALDGPALVAAWAAESLVLGWAARRFRDPRGYFGAIVFLGLAVVHAVVVEAPPDALRVGVDDFASAAAAVAIVGVAAAASSRIAHTDDLRVAFAGVAAVAAVYLPSLAIVSAFEGDELEPGQTPQVLLSAFWALAGLAALVAGLQRDLRALRLGGLGLLLIAAVKVFLYDLAELESIYRALSFIALGLLLLGGAFAYQRIRRETTE